MRKLIATIAFALAGLSAAPAVVAAQSAGDFAPGELLVRFEPGGERLLRLPERISVTEAADALGGNPSVRYAVPNYLARAAAVPNDPGMTGTPGDWRRAQWNFLPCGSLCGQPSQAPFEAKGGIDAVGAWDVLAQRGVAGAKGVRVAILDTGIAFRNKKPGFRKSPDFGAKQFLPGLDAVKKGRSKKGKVKKKGDYLPLDREGHGTHVAGTIAERTNNGVALTGLASRARIIPVRVLDSQGIGTARDIARGIRYASKSGADVINMSFEFSLSVNSCNRIKSVCRAIRRAAKRGAVIVSAAGNSNGEPIAFPGAAPRVVGVGRTTKDACLADQSRTGGGLDLVAPGGGLPLSTTCGTDDQLFSRDVPIFQLTFSGPSFRRFGYPFGYEGTSMASSHVSGVAAMVIASGVVGKDPAPLTVECQLRGTARTTTAQLGQPYDPRFFGSGLLDAAAAVTARAPGC